MPALPRAHRSAAVPKPVATNRRPVIMTLSRTNEPRYAPSANKNPRVRTTAAMVALQKSIRRNGTTGSRAATIGAIPWMVALTRAAFRNADRCSWLSSTSIARSMLWRWSFFSTRSASYAPTAEEIASAIEVLTLTAITKPALPARPPRAAAAPRTMPRTVRAPSNAPITKYRRTTGPRSVTSSSSRHPSRIRRRFISPARGEGGDHFALRRVEGRVEGLHLWASALREVGPPTSLPAEDIHGRGEEGRGIHASVRAPGHDDARGLARGAQDRDDVRVLRELLRQREQVLHRAGDAVDDDPHVRDLVRMRDELGHGIPRGRGPSLLEFPPLLPPLIVEPVDGGG